MTPPSGNAGGTPHEEHSSGRSGVPGKRATLTWRQTFGFYAGLVSFVAVLVSPTPAGLTDEGWRVTAILAVMAVFWVSEALPVAATALLPIVLLPMTGVMPVGDAAAPYANPLVFLMLGGFVIALAVQQSGLHRRMALWLLGRAGMQPERLIAAFMVATAFLSMWISNTATAALMLPIALSVIGLLAGDDGQAAATETPVTEIPVTETPVAGAQVPGFAIALLLSIAFGANIGGMATLIGTPPNAILAGFVADRFGLEIGFAVWMAVGLPVALLLLSLSWLVLTRFAFRLVDTRLTGAEDLLAKEAAGLGPVRPAERRVAMIFALTALLWLTRPAIQSVIPMTEFLSDPVIAIAAACLFFMVPAGDPEERRRPLLRWEATNRLPWGVLILIGGGLSLGHAIETTGLSGFVGQSFSGMAMLGPAILLPGLAAAVMVLSHFMSNTATAAIFMPIAASVALAGNLPPIAVMGVVALAASAAFMMPVATPPNAIVFSSGLVSVGDMLRGGMLVTVAALPVITILGYILMSLLFGSYVPGDDKVMPLHGDP